MNEHIGVWGYEEWESKERVGAYVCKFEQIMKCTSNKIEGIQFE